MSAVNPAVVRMKFDREVSQLTSDAARFRSKGVFLLEAAFPTVLVGFATPQLKPPALVMAVLLDYADFDLQAPSVRFVDQFTGIPYTSSELPTQMLRSVETPLPDNFPMPIAPPVPGDDGRQIEPAPAPRPVMLVPQALIQVHEGGVPFLCLPGVREFHEHPGHSGQPWELERTIGAGALVRLVEVIHQYAIAPVGGWSVNLVPQVSLGMAEAPR